ncbi:MAG TPA: cytochrome c oxidase subunit II [Gemmatimonadaceae bacterium]|nr:cytochrome c oxidase subunit II [Gemmatimonadaceae bacterium]
MHSLFDPQSPQARAVAHLWWWMLGVGGTVWLGVVLFAIYAAMHPRGNRASDGLEHVSPETHHRVERVVAGAGFATVLILLAFLIFDFSVGHALAVHPQRGLTIDVVGHQWWWEAQYEDPDPSKMISTANEIHVPTGQMIQFKLRAADVIHSFWAPNLNGKRDLIPGYTSTLWFKADTAGVYRGQCAEFCGLQHAKMAFYIIAEPPVKFAAWMAAASRPQDQPTDSTLLYGQRIFMSSGCAVCHSIAGTEARSTVGPGLTHLKSRNTIAAGTLANTRENLVKWVSNPQNVKPGARMPAYQFTEPQLTALISYLETLK